MANGDNPKYLAVDMGAESARAIAGWIEQGTLRMEELHRWPSRNVTVRGVQYWDILFMFAEIKSALREFSRRFGPDLAGIGVDSWGVDFGILGPSGQLLQNPVQYRDHRTDGMMARAFQVLPQSAIYTETGIAFLQFNSLYQLLAIKETAPELLREGRTFLMMSDLLHYFLSGIAKCEYTNASTTQLLDVRTRTWSKILFDAFGLPRDLMPEIAAPGTILGPLEQAIAEDAGLNPCAVITPCTHDTASAVLAVPALGESWAYISCGTWSLMGAELAEPVTTADALACNFTNEGGHGGTIRFLKNIMGLWVLQQARASWAKRGAEYDYAELTAMAREAPAFQAYLNIDEPLFLNPPDMLEAIAEHCRATGQQPPQDAATTARVILESLALRYAITLRDLERVTGRHFDTIHMVGGGTQNGLLCQMASDAMGRPVFSGPVEGTAMGNIVTQAIATGQIADRDTARKIVARSCEMRTYEPSGHGAWKPWLARYSG